MKKGAKPIRIGLLGLGTVGSGVWRLIARNGDLMKERGVPPLVIRRVAVSKLAGKRDVTVPKNILTNDPMEVVRDPEIDVIVEVMGGIHPAEACLKEALRRGKHIVTANKALLAERGVSLLTEAARYHRAVGFEAAVAGGIPLIKSLREGFVANRILEIYGIINGTSNFILSEMTQKGVEFKEALRVAQQRGYAEKNPSLDVKGIDAAQKLSILLMLCYGINPSQKDISVEGIENIDRQDIEFARRLGYVIKLLAIAKDHGDSIEARVHPTFVPEHHPLADVTDAFNAVYLKGDAVGEAMFFGRGAGRMPTASAVVSDIAMIAKGLIPPAKDLLPRRKAKILPMEDLTSEYYLRFMVMDRPGVLARITRYLGGQGISIANVYQQEKKTGLRVPVVVTTHRTREKDLKKAVSTIDRQAKVLGKTVVIRMERFAS